MDPQIVSNRSKLETLKIRGTFDLASFSSLSGWNDKWKGPFHWIFSEMNGSPLDVLHFSRPISWHFPFYCSWIFECTLASYTSHKTYILDDQSNCSFSASWGKTVPFDKENFQNLKPENLAEWKAKLSFSVILLICLGVISTNFSPAVHRTPLAIHWFYLHRKKVSGKLPVLVFTFTFVSTVIDCCY